MWPSGRTQVFTDIALNSRLRLVEEGALARSHLVPRRPFAAPPAPKVAPPPHETWLYEPFPAPEFSARDATGATRSLAALGGRPALLLDLVRQGGAVPRGARGAVRRLRPSDAGGHRRSGDRARRAGRRRERRHLAEHRRQPGHRAELRDPQPPRVHEPAGSAASRRRFCWTPREESSRSYRDRLDVPAILRDAARIEVDSRRAAGACPALPGSVVFAPLAFGTTFPTGGSCWIRAWRPPALVGLRARRAR